MKYVDLRAGIADADSAEDAEPSYAHLEQQLAEARAQILELPAGHAPVDKARLQLRAGAALVELNQKEEAWDTAREAFDVCAQARDWEQAVIACDVMFRAERPDSLPALGQGVWLAVTFPIDPELTVAMLQHVIDDTPDDSDGGAVAAAVAHYVVTLRAEGRERDNLLLFTNQMLATVARRHSDADTQEKFDRWAERLELKEPAQFLPRLRNVVDVLVQDEWWIDRDSLHAELPA